MKLTKYFLFFIAVLIGSMLIINPLLKQFSSFWLQVIGGIVLATLAVLPLFNNEAKELIYKAEKDAMSDLYRRETFVEILEKEIARSQRYKHIFSLVVIDLDHFKQVNDVFGHAEGDKVIGFLGDSLRKLKREIDVAGRLGGEEFGLLLPETEAEGAKVLIKRIQDYIRNQPTSKVNEITFSAGIAEFPTDAEKSKALINKADQALYKAKEERDSVVIFQEGSQPPSQDHVQSDLRHE